MLVAEEVVQGVGQLLGSIAAQPGIALVDILDVLLAIDAIVVQGIEGSALVGLAVVTALDDALDEHPQRLVVGLAGGHHLFEQGHSFLHILSQAVDTHSDAFSAYTDAVVASQFVELFLKLLGGVLVCVEEFQQVGGQVDGLVNTAAELETILQVECAVLHVLHIEHLAAIGGLALLQVFLEVDEDRLDGLCLVGGILY